MASNGGRINFQVGFNVDKSGLNSLKSSLQELQKIKPTSFDGNIQELRKIKDTANLVQQALTKAFNTKLGTLNIQQFNQQLQKSKLSVNEIYAQFSKAGATGQVAFNKMASSVLTTNLQLRQTNSLVSRMGTTMMNTIKWTFASSMVQQFTNGIRQAFQYVQALDASLTDIRIVTGDSTEQMRQFAQQANKAAQALGRSTMDYTKAALTFYQQGLDDQSVAARTQATLQAQNITGAGDEMADYLTAVWNGYKVANEQAQLYVDRLAAVADSSASNMAQLATAMSKVAATANAMGVDVDQLNAQIATIIATTRQAPQTVGNALKTIFARINDIQAGTQDAQVSLGHYTGTMAELGINVLDASGHLRDTGQVMEEIGGKWATMSREQQIYLARTMAGQRQYNNLIALFDNWGRYTELVNVSMESQGTLMEKNSRYMDSLGAKMQQLGAAGEKVKDAIMNEEDMKGMIGFAAGAVNVFGNFIESIGGARGALLGLASILTSVFSGVISKEINNLIVNFQSLKSNSQAIANDIQQTFTMAASEGYAKGAITEMVNAKKQIVSLYGVMSAEQINNYNNLVKQVGEERNREIILNKSVDNAKALEQVFATMAGSDGNISSVAENAAGALQNLNMSLTDIKNSESNLTFDKLKQQVENVITAMGAEGTSAVEKFRTTLNNIDTTNTENAFGSLVRATRTLYNTLSQQFDDYSNLQNLSNQADAARQQIKNLQDQLTRIREGKQQLFNVQNAVSFVGAIGRISAGITSVVNLTRVWKNQNLSAGQKILQTFTNLGFVIPMIVSALGSMRKVIMSTSVARSMLAEKGIAEANIRLAQHDLEIKAYQRETAAINARNAALEYGFAVLKFQKANEAFYNATDGSKEEEKALANVVEAETAKQAAKAKSEKADAALQEAIDEQIAAKATLKNAQSNIAEGASAGAATTENEILSASLKHVAVSAATALLPLLPFIIAAGAAAAAIYVFYKQWNSANETAENAAKQVAQAKERYDQLKQAFEDLKSSFEKYDSIKDSLSDLTRGTQEWRDALLEANDVVLQLLSTYPQLASQISHDENGMLILSQEARDNLLNSQRQQMMAARGASIVATINSQDAATMARAASIGQHTQGAAFVNETGLIDFTGSPQLVASIARHVAEGIIDTETLQQLTGADEQFIDALLQNTDQLAALGQELISNQDATRLNYQTMANQALTDQSAYRGLTQAERDVADAVVGLDLEKRVDQITASLQQTELGITRFTTGSNETLQNLLTRYMQGTGAQGLRWRSNAVTSESGQLVFHLTDTEGNDLDLTQDLFNNTIAVAEALQEIQGNTLETVTQMLDAIDNFQSQAAAQGVRRLLSNQDLSSLTSGQLDALSQRPDELQRFFSNEDNYTAAGYQSGEAFANAFYESVNNAQQRFENVLLKYAGTSLFESVRSILEGGDFSLAASQNITKAIEQAFQHGGQNGVNSLMGMLENIDPQNLEEVYNLLGGVDWTAPDAVYQLQSGLSNLGISVEDLGPDFEEFCNWIDRTANSAYNALDPLAKLKNLFNSFNEIQDLAPGEVIDDQLYQKLADLAPELRELFIEAANGHLFIGAQQDVYNILNNQTENLIEQFENAKQAAQQLLDSDISGLFSNINLPTTPGQAISQDDISAYRELLSNDVFGQGLDAVGVSRDQIDADLQWLEQHSETAYQNLNQRQQQYYDSTVSRLNSVLDRIDQLQTRAENGDFGDQSRYQVVAAQAFEYDNPIQQLRNFVRQNQTTVEMYNQVRDAAVEREVERLDITREAYDQTFSVLYNHLQNTSESFQSLSEEEKNIQLDQLTIQVYQLGQALDDLAQMSSEDFQLIQQHLNGIVSADSAQAIGTLQEKLANIFDVPINTKFIEQNFDLIQRLAYGDITALDELQRALGQDYVATLRAQTDDVQIQSELDNLSNIINGIDFNDIQIGMSLDDAPFADALIDAALRAGMSADEINELLAGIGFQPEVTSQWIPFQELTDGYNRYTSTYHYVAPDGTETDIPVSIEQYNAASGAGGIEIPIINNKKIKYTGGSRAAQMARPSYTGAKRPSGGGGGGGKSSGSTAKPTVQKASQDKRDPYHDINRLLEKQEEKLKIIQKQDKKLVNRDRLNNINAQNKALEEQADLFENKLAIAESEQIRLRNQLLADTNGYAQFGRDGELTNFNQMLANAQQQYNNYIAYYNTLTKEQQDAEKDRLELQKERYERVKDTAKEYEETLDLQRDLLEQINEAQEKQYENLIKASKIKVDLSIDAGDAERDWLDFENKVIKKLDKDDFLGNAKANIKELMSYFDSDQVQNTAKQIQSIRNQIAIMERGGTSSIYGNNLAQAKEDLEQYMKQQMDDLEKVQSLVDKIKEKYLDGIKQAKKQMDDQIDQYERVNDLIEHNVKLTQMLYGDKAYDTMNKYYELQERNNKAELDSLKKQQDFWQQKMNNEVIGSDAWNEFKNNLDNVTDDLNKKLEDMIDNLSDKWQNRVDGIIDKLNNSLTGGRGLDYLDEQWDYINDFDDNFLDAVESKLGIQQVQNLYEQAVADTAGDAKQQQRITDLMNQQIKILREKDKLTEYDVERAKAVLDVEKARMALEDARNNKTKMRLRRDSQGNYTYQYVADEEKLDDLQQALNDAQLNLYNQDKQHYKQNLDKLYDTYKDYIEKMRDLTAEYNATQDEEERARIQARIDLLKSASDEMMASLTEDNRQLLNYLDGSTLSALGIDGTQLTGEEIRQIVTTTVPQASSKIQDLTNSIAGQGGLLQVTAATLQEIVNTTDEYDKAVADILEMGGTSLDVITTVVDATGQAVDNNIVNVEKLIAQNDELIKSCDDQISAIQKLMSWLDQYMNKVMDAERLIANLRAAYNTDQVLNDSNLRALNEVLADTNLDTTAGMDVTSTVATNLSAAKKQIDALISIYERNLIDTLSKSAAFDTGGYTGSWEDQSGKLAILHGKELVLNENDTTNILAAVQVIRDITSALSGFIDRDIGNTVNDIGSIINTPTTEHDILDQNVHIEANFPNVTQHTQIEQAFNNLVNIASQYAARPATT